MTTKYKDPFYMQKWRQSNQENIRQYRKNYYEKNKEKEKNSASDWCKNNKERFRLILKAVYANTRYPGKLTIEDILFVIEKNGRKCHWCGKENLEGRDLTLEHLKPINNRNVLTIACFSCNAAKVHKTNGRRLTQEEKKENIKITKKKYESNNIDYLKQKKKEWAERNREKLNAYYKEWRLKIKVKL